MTLLVERRAGETLHVEVRPWLRLLVAIRLLVVLLIVVWPRAVAERKHLPDATPLRDRGDAFADRVDVLPAAPRARRAEADDRATADLAATPPGQEDTAARHGITTTVSPHAGQRTSIVR